MRRLQERLAVIDNAQNNIQSLAGQVVQLQAILSNKQTRGAFGQSDAPDRKRGVRVSADQYPYVASSSARQPPATDRMRLSVNNWRTN